MDLGSGGGVPGLVLAILWPTSSWALLDAMEKRTEFLKASVDQLGLQERVEVIRGRAEELGREDSLRTKFDFVSARGFAQPAVTAECASPFLKSGGVLVVSEPPEREDRWPSDGLAAFNMKRVASGNDSYAVISQTQICPDRFPRRTGIPSKRPLF